MFKPFDCISDFIFLENKVEKVDVILVPGGSHPELIEKASDLFLDGFSDYILPSGGTNSKLEGIKTEWDYFQKIAIKKGVPENKILKENLAQNTFDNARLSLKVLKNKKINFDKVIIVCKAFHSRRALLTYQTVFPLNTKFIVVPIIDKRKISKNNWFLDEEKIKKVMSEVEKIGKYFGKHIKNWI